jgi:hypothetical protein
MGFGLGRRLKKAVKKAVGDPLGGKLFKKAHNKFSILKKIGIGVNSKGEADFKSFMDPAGIFTGKADQFHQGLGIGVRPPKISGMGTDPEGERIAAETKAAQQSALMSTMKRRLRRQSMLSVAGSLKGTKDRPMKLSSVIAQGKMATGE